MTRRRGLLLGAGALAGAALGGCGFTLRGALSLPFERIALSGFAPRSPLAQALQRALEDRARVVATPAEAQVVLHAVEDVRERAVAASTSFGQVRELQLRVRLVFRLATGGGVPLAPAAELLQERDLSYSETIALAKEQEEAELFRGMTDDLVVQVLRRLAAVRLPA